VHQKTLTTLVSASSKSKRPNGSGTYYVSKQKPEVIQAVVKDVHGKPHNKSFRFELNNKASYSRAEVAAQEWIAEQNRSKSLGIITFAASPNTKVEAFLHSWLESRVPYIRPSTYRNYLGAINNWIIPFIGDQKLSTVTSNSVEALYGQLKSKGYKPGTTNVVHRVLGKAFKDAVRKQLLIFNPMTNVERLKGNSTPTRPICLADFRKIYKEATKNPYMHARVEIGMVLSPRPEVVWPNSIGGCAKARAHLT
jgi:hypothetical protein